MNGVREVVLVALRDTVLQILVDVFRQEGGDARHHNGGVQQHIKQSVEGGELLLRAFLTLHSGAVEADIPVGKLLKELKHMLDDIIKAVVIHLSTHNLDQMLVGSDDPSVHNVGVSSLRKLILEKGIEDEVVSTCFLPARDVLNEESVGIEPREEYISHNTLNSVSGEFKGLSSNDW